MSSAEELSNEQVHKLATFSDISHINDPQRCQQILAAHDWDVEGAVHTILASGIPGTPGRGSAAHQPQLDGIQVPSNSSQNNNLIPNIAEIDEKNEEMPDQPQSASSAPQMYQETWVGTINNTINNIPGGFIVTGAAGFAARTFLPTAVTGYFTEASPSETPAQQFVREFTQHYSGPGSHIPAFFQGTHAEAMAQSKRLGRYLFVYIHCVEHDDTDNFVRQTLCSPLVVECLNQNFVCWGGNLKQQDAYKLANRLHVQGYPYYCIMGESVARRSQYTSLTKHEGPISPERMVTQLHTLIEEHRNRLAAREAQRLMDRAEANIRVEQDREFQEAVEADKRRKLEAENEERRRREEAQELKRQQEEEERELRRQEEDRLAKLAAVPDEPSLEQKEGVIGVQIRLPDGSRVQRRFNESDKLQGLFNFIESHELEIDGEKLESYQVATRFPRQVLTDHEKTFLEAGLRRSASLFVEEKD